MGAGTDSGSARSRTPASAHAESPTPRGALCGQLPRGVGLSDADEPRGWRWGERALRGEDRRNSHVVFLDGTLSLAPRSAASRGSGGIRSLTDLAGIWPVPAWRLIPYAASQRTHRRGPRETRHRRDCSPTSLDSTCAPMRARRLSLAWNQESIWPNSATYSRLGLYG
jgi:hypothetical protein